MAKYTQEEKDNAARRYGISSSRVDNDGMARYSNFQKEIARAFPKESEDDKEIEEKK